MVHTPHHTIAMPIDFPFGKMSVNRTEFQHLDILFTALNVTLHFECKIEVSDTNFYSVVRKWTSGPMHWRHVTRYQTFDRLRIRIQHRIMFTNSIELSANSNYSFNLFNDFYRVMRAPRHNCLLRHQMTFEPAQLIRVPALTHIDHCNLQPFSIFKTEFVDMTLTLKL